MRRKHGWQQSVGTSPPGRPRATLHPHLHPQHRCSSSNSSGCSSGCSSGSSSSGSSSGSSSSGSSRSSSNVAPEDAGFTGTIATALEEGFHMPSTTSSLIGSETRCYEMCRDNQALAEGINTRPVASSK
mmetsp:Transcript_26123/g.77488  ORF Transcript_26123/g.77488 Transcript_26123/m.77488 type:complete len:129 (+) Transcript_26123:200-586(+)